jgi:hypothetical protein
VRAQISGLGGTDMTVTAGVIAELIGPDGAARLALLWTFGDTASVPNGIGKRIERYLEVTRSIALRHRQSSTHHVYLQGM